MFEEIVKLSELFKLTEVKVVTLKLMAKLLDLKYIEISKEPN